MMIDEGFQMTTPIVNILQRNILRFTQICLDSVAVLKIVQNFFSGMFDEMFS